MPRAKRNKLTSSAKTYQNVQSVQVPSPYEPYVGTLREHIATLIEANESVPPRNFGFLLLTDARIQLKDPRPKQFRITELERVWGGPSRRFWQIAPKGCMHPCIIFNGTIPSERNCTDLILGNGTYREADPMKCGSGLKDCCPSLDLSPKAGLKPLDALRCGVGVAPTLCRGATRWMLENTSDISNTSGPHRIPYPFRVLYLPVYNSTTP